MKKIILLLATAVCVLSFSSCVTRGHSSYSSESGTYKVVRDASGQIILNENDEICVYVMNENGRKRRNALGEIMTQYVPFGGALVDGRYVETDKLIFTLPSGFSAADGDVSYFSNKSGAAEIFVDFVPSVSMKTASDSYLADCGNKLESLGSSAYSYSAYELKAKSGNNVSAIKETNTFSGKQSSEYNYYIESENGHFKINCACEGTAGFDFDSFVKTFVVKYG